MSAGSRSRRRAGSFLAAAVVLGLAAWTTAPQQPEPRRIDLLLARAVVEMQETAAAGPVVEIPRYARAAGMREGPPGSTEPWAEVLVRGAGAEAAVLAAGGRTGVRSGEILTATVPLSRVIEMSQAPGVVFVEGSRAMYPLLDTSIPEIGVDQLHSPVYDLEGQGVLVAILDSGVDFTHADFRDPAGNTRIVAIWDQTVAGSGPVGFSNTAGGMEWDSTQINAELASPTGTVAQTDITGHGTHVAGIAAGDGSATGNAQPADRHVGVAPLADILVIKGGDDTFDSVNVVEGVQYAFWKATQLGGVPCVVNLSLGGQYGSHDGTSNYETGLSSATGVGKVVVISAGNSGGGAVHGQVTLSGSGATGDLVVTVPAYTAESGTENDFVHMNAWFATSASVRTTVTSPNSTTYGPFNFPDGGGTVQDKAAGAVWVASGSGGALGAANVILVDIEDRTEAQFPVAGNWTVTFELTSGTSALVDLWIYETAFGDTDLPATVSGATDHYSLAVPGTAEDPITAGSYVTKWIWPALAGGSYTYDNTTNRTADYSLFTSWGPTRDGRIKPEISAPGQGIMSALATTMPTPQLETTDPDGVHRLSQGTSQSAPHVTGVAALMLQQDPTLSNDLIKAYLIGSARTDAYTGSVPNDTWGYGKLDGKGAVDLVMAGGDTITPSITLGLLRNTVLTDYLDIVVIPDEVLAEAPDVDVSGTSVTMAFFGTSEGTVYTGDYRLTSGGAFSISATARDFAGNDTTVTRNFAAARALPGASASLTSTDGLVTALIPAGAVSRAGYVLLMDAEREPPADREGPDSIPAFGRTLSAEGGIGPARALLPTGEDLNASIRLTFRYRPDMLDGAEEGTLTIARLEDGAWVPVQSWVDIDRRLVEATVERFGVYRLQSGEATGLPDLLRTALHPNYPNPFNGGTQVRFSLARPTDVELYVLNVRGQRVRTLLDGQRPAGDHVVTWDGRGGEGRRLASGVYLLVLKVDGKLFTRKALLLQ